MCGKCPPTTHPHPTPRPHTHTGMQLYYRFTPNLFSSGLFEEAEKDQKKMGINSALHIIIFDEIDAICRSRGSLSGSTGVHDTVVNQLLAKVCGRVCVVWADVLCEGL